MRDDANQAALSHDGSQIAFMDTNTHDIWVMNADGSGARSLIKHDEGFRLFAPTWFPNDKRISYVKFKVENGVTTLLLESRNRDGGDPQVMLANPRLTWADWGQNGHLVYSVREPQPRVEDANLWEIPIDLDTGKPKGSPHQLTDWTGFLFTSLAITDDGKRLVFLNQKQQSDVYVAQIADGGNELKPPQRITLDERNDWPGGWTPDSKNVLFYSNRNGSFDIYRQGVSERNPETIVSGTEDKSAPQASPDGKWVLYLQYPKSNGTATPNAGKLMRIPVGGGASEAVMDVKGQPWMSSASDPADFVGGYPSFRCPTRAQADCVLAEFDGKQLVFTAFDPGKGRKAEVAHIAAANPDFMAWDLSGDGSKVAVSTFDYVDANIDILSLAGGQPQKLSLQPWAQLTAVTWAADAKSLFVASYSSRGTAIVHADLSGKTKLLIKPVWDIYSLSASPDGQYLAFGPVVTNANAWTIPNLPEK